MSEDVMKALIAEAKRQNAPPIAEELTKEQFCERFKAHMLKRAGPTFDDGESIAEYADQAAVGYWECDFSRADGPEDAADADMSYWGED